MTNTALEVIASSSSGRNAQICLRANIMLTDKHMWISVDEMRKPDHDFPIHAYTKVCMISDSLVVISMTNYGPHSTAVRGYTCAPRDRKRYQSKCRPNWDIFMFGRLIKHYYYYISDRACTTSDDKPVWNWSCLLWKGVSCVSCYLSFRKSKFSAGSSDPD